MKNIAIVTLAQRSIFLSFFLFLSVLSVSGQKFEITPQYGYQVGTGGSGVSAGGALLIFNFSGGLVIAI